MMKKLALAALVTAVTGCGGHDIKTTPIPYSNAWIPLETPESNQRLTLGTGFGFTGAVDSSCYSFAQGSVRPDSVSNRYSLTWNSSDSVSAALSIASLFGVSGAFGKTAKGTMVVHGLRASRIVNYVPVTTGCVSQVDGLPTLPAITARLTADSMTLTSVDAIGVAARLDSLKKAKVAADFKVVVSNKDSVVISFNSPIVLGVNLGGFERSGSDSVLRTDLSFEKWIDLAWGWQAKVRADGADTMRVELQRTDPGGEVTLQNTVADGQKWLVVPSRVGTKAEAFRFQASRDAAGTKLDTMTFERLRLVECTWKNGSSKAVAAWVKARQQDLKPSGRCKG